MNRHYSCSLCRGLPEYSSIFSRNCGDMASESAEAFPGLLSCVLPNLLLQTIGFFSPYWIKNDTTTECYRGVVYNVNCPNNVEGLGNAVIGLQATFLAIIVITAISSPFLLCSKDESECSNFVRWWFLVYLISGVLGFTGCMIVVYNFNNYRWSFYLCLVASCFVMLQMVVCENMRKEREKKEKEERTRRLLERAALLNNR